MLKDIIEHFPSVRGNKGDPQLVWGFANSEVIIRSMETSLDTRGELHTWRDLDLLDDLGVLTPDRKSAIGH